MRNLSIIIFCLLTAFGYSQTNSDSNVPKNSKLLLQIGTEFHSQLQLNSRFGFPGSTLSGSNFCVEALFEKNLNGYFSALGGFTYSHDFFNYNSFDFNGTDVNFYQFNSNGHSFGASTGIKGFSKVGKFTLFGQQLLNAKYHTISDYFASDAGYEQWGTGQISVPPNLRKILIYYQMQFGFQHYGKRDWPVSMMFTFGRQINSLAPEEGIYPGNNILSDLTPWKFGVLVGTSLSLKKKK